ncbi:hypothetical protein FIBSPDRAFT_258767 [Athelia psychrophila]|uniref:Uncharacterized protein n=1 Tax=Athelia psychrophila TaxID=1759441 RepID=A0A166RMP0_9AGAM|nr:hypothetical protein FIBSPDRAFT_258767 [Fibularhizoctonia sp. CBS 109695]
MSAAEHLYAKLCICSATSGIASQAAASSQHVPPYILGSMPNYQPVPVPSSSSHIYPRTELHFAIAIIHEAVRVIHTAYRVLAQFARRPYLLASGHTPADDCTRLAVA